MRWWEILLICLIGGIIAATLSFLLHLIIYNWHDALLSGIGTGIGLFLATSGWMFFDYFKCKKKNKEKLNKKANKATAYYAVALFMSFENQDVFGRCP